MASLFDGIISKEMELDIIMYVLFRQVTQNCGDIRLRVCETRSYNRDINLTYFRSRSFTFKFFF